MVGRTSRDGGEPVVVEGGNVGLLGGRLLERQTAIAPHLAASFKITDAHAGGMQMFVAFEGFLSPFRLAGLGSFQGFAFKRIHETLLFQNSVYGL